MPVQASACGLSAGPLQLGTREIIEPLEKGAESIHGARVFLARHAQGTSLAGEPPKKWIGILRYPSLDEALAFDSSPEYKALKPIRDQSTKWRSFVVEGLPNQ